MKKLLRLIIAPITISLALAFGSIFLATCSSGSKQNALLYEISGPKDVAALVDSIPDVKLVLLGESTHGTSEYYVMRRELSKKLIEQRDIAFIVVEGDWASLYRLNNYILGKETSYKSAEEVVKSFDRWPQWMWANAEVVELAEWLKRYNADKELKDRVHFYGMDVYGQWEALDRLLEFTKANNQEVHEQIKQKSICFSQFRPDEWSYAQTLAQGQTESCEKKLKEIVEIIRTHKEKLSKVDERAYFEALQNAYVLKNAESFYRLSVLRRGSPDSWNSRARHMTDTVERLLKKHGRSGIVWAHNTHVGDASATEMKQRGQINIGQLVRQNYGREDVFILGFSTYSGKVHAGTSWGSPRATMTIPDAMEGSYEDLLHSFEKERFFIIFKDEHRQAKSEFARTLGHRAIGVVYNPANERGNYVTTILSKRYDGIVYFKETSELDPIE